MFHDLTTININNPQHYFEIFIKKLLLDYTIITPGDSLNTTKPPVCLTFDDAYFDYYKLIFPVLRKHKIRAAQQNS